MKAKRASLQLSFFGVDRIRIEPNEKYKPAEEQGRGTVCPDIDIGVEVGPNENQCVVTMVISIEESAGLEVPVEAVPYFLSLRIVGLFEVDSDVVEKERSCLTQLNAPAMLYGLARAEVCHLTERSRYGQLILPSVNFIGMAQEVLASQKAQSNADE